MRHYQVSKAGYINSFLDTAKKATMAAVATGIATSAHAEKKSVAAAQSALTDALQLALTLEYLEDEYYAMYSGESRPCIPVQSGPVLGSGLLLI